MACAGAGAAEAVPLSTGRRGLRLPIEIPRRLPRRRCAWDRHPRLVRPSEGEVGGAWRRRLLALVHCRRAGARPAAREPPHRHSSGGSGSLPADAEACFSRSYRRSLPCRRRGGRGPGPRLASNVGFVGSDNPVNSHALAWFLDRVWLTILDQTPNARLVAAGNICSVLPSCGSIVARGPVDDLSPIYATCSFMLNPAQAGTGLKIKTVEALAFGRCVVTTPAGAEGVEDLAGKGLIVGATPAAFSAAVTDLLRDPARAAALGELGHREIGKLNGLNRTALQALLSIPSQGENSGRVRRHRRRTTPSERCGSASSSAAETALGRSRGRSPACPGPRNRRTRGRCWVSTTAAPTRRRPWWRASSLRCPSSQCVLEPEPGLLTGAEPGLWLRRQGRVSRLDRRRRDRRSGLAHGLSRRLRGGAGSCPVRGSGAPSAGGRP